jgi:hypothetical protein
MLAGVEVGGWGQHFKQGKGKVNVRGLYEQVLLTAVQAQITLTTTERTQRFGAVGSSLTNEGKTLLQAYQYTVLHKISRRLMYGKLPLERCNLEKYVNVIVLSTTLYKTQEGTSFRASFKFSRSFFFCTWGATTRGGSICKFSRHVLS